MNEQAPESHQRRRIKRAKWRCPSCETLVPRENEACRCGFLKAWRGTNKSRADPNPQFLLLVGAGVLSALITLWMLLN